MSLMCPEFAGALIEMARGGPVPVEEQQGVLAHLRRCPECARRLDEQRALHVELSRLAAAEVTVDERITARVMAEFDRAAPVREQTARPVSRWVWAAGLAAVVTLAAFSTLRPSPGPPVAPVMGRQESPFLPIPYTIPLAPEERAEVVRMRIPVTALLAAGFRLQVDDPSIDIEAEVVVSQDGRARAIRPLTPVVFD